MNRKEAKIWASIPRGKLAVIAPNLDKHFDVLCAFANGAIIEFKNSEDSWVLMGYPSFSENEEYRVKPNEMKPGEPWKPKIGDEYFFVTFDGIIETTKWFNTPYDEMIFNFGNCFPTCEEAEAALERVRAALKGEIISKK